jgi:hypothetical protein
MPDKTNVIRPPDQRAACTTDDPLLLFGVKATYGETKCQLKKFIPVYYFFERQKLE